MTVNSPDSLPEDEPQKEKAGTQGKDDGTMPQGGKGVGIAANAEPNTFEPEEDPDATEEPGR